MASIANRTQVSPAFWASEDQGSSRPPTKKRAVGRCGDLDLRTAKKGKTSGTQEWKPSRGFRPPAPGATGVAAPQKTRIRVGGSDGEENSKTLQNLFDDLYKGENKSIDRGENKSIESCYQVIRSRATSFTVAEILEGLVYCRSGVGAARIIEQVACVKGIPRDQMRKVQAAVRCLRSRFRDVDTQENLAKIEANLRAVAEEEPSHRGASAVQARSHAACVTSEMPKDMEEAEFVHRVRTTGVTNALIWVREEVTKGQGDEHRMERLVEMCGRLPALAREAYASMLPITRNQLVVDMAMAVDAGDACALDVLAWIDVDLGSDLLNARVTPWWR